MTIRAIAPAKINWTLEVLGKRADGYHEVRSVMQTIDLCDEVELSPAPDLLERSRVPTGVQPGRLHLRPSPHGFSYASNLASPRRSGLVLGASVIHATSLLDPDWRKDVRTSLFKRIPIAAGLGGGSSDAAATLRGLNRLWDLGLPHEELARKASEIGSDVPFFLTGGTALAEGRGERVTPLPDAPEMWLVVVAPPIFVPEKTKTMYGALRSEDFGDGQQTEGLVERLRRGERVREEDTCNAFERAAYESFEGLADYRDRLLGAGAASVHVAGSGPALFAVFDSREEAEAVVGRMAESEARVFVARTLGAAEATRTIVE